MPPRVFARALIGQSATVYCASKIMEKLRVLRSFYGL